MAMEGLTMQRILLPLKLVYFFVSELNCIIFILNLRNRWLSQKSGTGTGSETTGGRKLRKT